MKAYWTTVETCSIIVSILEWIDTLSTEIKNTEFEGPSSASMILLYYFTLIYLNSPNISVVLPKTHLWWKRSLMKKEPGVSSTRCFFLMGEISKGTFTGEINLICIAIETLTLSTGHTCFFQTHSGIFEIAQELARWKVLNRPMAWLVDKLQPAWSVWLLTEDSPTPNPSVSEIGMGVYSIYTSGFPDLSWDEHPRYKLVLVLGC